MGLCLGIGKRELLEDYYMDEIGSIAQAWNELHNPRANETEVISPKRSSAAEERRLEATAHDIG